MRVKWFWGHNDRKFGHILTRRSGHRRITGVTPYHNLLVEAIGERIVLQVAREWGVPQWVLYDGLREEAKVPSAKYMSLVAHGCGMTVEELLARIAPVEETTQRLPMVSQMTGKEA